MKAKHQVSVSKQQFGARCRSLRARRGRRNGGGSSPGDGFVLPVSIGASLLLVLSGLSLQTATLQARARLGSTLRLRHSEDALLSAAQQLIGQLNQRHGCLLVLPLPDWQDQGTVCADAGEQAGLEAGDVLGVPFRLVEWSPGSSPAGDGSRAELLLELGPAGDRLPQRAAFSVQLTGTPPRAVDLREQGLRGVGP